MQLQLACISYYFKAINKCPIAHLNIVLDSEWNVLFALHQALKKLPITVVLELVENHQDDDPTLNLNDLMLRICLNIKANEPVTISLRTLLPKLQFPLD